jgi:hypothetical protein
MHAAPLTPAAAVHRGGLPLGPPLWGLPLWGLLPSAAAP